MNAWISASSGLCAAKSDCRRASAANSDECTSGTQCARTLRRVAAGGCAADVVGAGAWSGFRFHSGFRWGYM